MSVYLPDIVAYWLIEKPNISSVNSPPKVYIQRSTQISSEDATAASLDAHH